MFVLQYCYKYWPYHLKNVFLEGMLIFLNKLIFSLIINLPLFFTSGHRRCLHHGRAPYQSRRQRVLLSGIRLPRSGGGYAVGCEVEGASPDDRREEDHALARNRSAIGYTFTMQAGI